MSKAPGKTRLWPALLLSAVVLLFLLGPTLFLNILLAWVIPGLSGAAVSYDQARAGLFLNSASVDGLKVEFPDASGELQPFEAESLKVHGLAAGKLLRLIFRPESLTAGPVFLAEDLRIKNFRQPAGPVQDRLDSLHLRGLSLLIAPARFQPPLSFDKLEVEGLSLSLPGLERRLEISGLEARGLSPDSLAELKVRGFSWRPENENAEPPLSLDIAGLTVGGLKIEALGRMLSGGGELLPWWLLSGCDSLDMAQARLSREGKPALNLKSALFDFHEKGPQSSFVRRLDFSADLPLLSGDSPEPLWADLRDLLGEQPQGSLSLEFVYDRAESLAALNSAALELDNLGRLDFSGRLTGVSPLPPHSSPSQLLYDSRLWRLAGLSATFEDHGFMANYYRHLNRTVFRGQPGYRTVDNLMDYFVRPLADNLEQEQGLANLPALLSEVEVFFRRPEKFRLAADPAVPLALSLANPDKYDIIEKLRLTLEVNDRAPIAVAVASGVFQERLPSSPRPLEKLFTEEDL